MVSETWNAGPLGRGLCLGGRVPSDPRGPSLARISSFHGEGSELGRGRGGPVGPRDQAWKERKEGAVGEGFPRLVPDALTISLHCFSEHSSATSSEHLQPVSGGDPIALVHAGREAEPWMDGWGREANPKGVAILAVFRTTVHPNQIQVLVEERLQPC